MTVFLTSHDTGDIEQVCDRVLLIDHGTVVLDTTLAELKRDHMTEKRIEVVTAEPTIEVDLVGIEKLEESPHRLVVRVDTSRQPVDRVVHHLMTHGTVRDITVSDPTLERVIATLYQERA